MKPESTIPKSCDRCLRKAVCMVYYGDLDLRFIRNPATDLLELMGQLDRELAPICDFYLEEAGCVSPRTSF
jgi:hypothetical protein